VKVARRSRRRGAPRGSRLRVAAVDAEILVAHVLGVTRSELALDRPRKLRVRRRRARGARRAARAREPLAYVLGEWGFRRLTLDVDRRVLVPRPETEVVVERCLAASRTRRAARARRRDGSGAIALAIADEHPGAR
jgi:release factor glutamine methyltransferase